MMQRQLQKPSCIDYGVALRPAWGETVCGDAFVVKSFKRNILLAVIDGAGHGPEAAAAAAAAAAVLAHYGHKPLTQLVEHCHRVLSWSRGVAMTLISIYSEASELSWLGVGNVRGCLFRADRHAKPRSETILLRGGIVGFRLPMLYPLEMSIKPGDWLLLATDGIRGEFNENFKPEGAPDIVADRLLRQYVKGEDDALVLAARYCGNGDE